MTRALQILAALGVVVLLIAAGSYSYLRSSLPQVRGSKTVETFSAPVEIVRDRYDVPHIYAESMEDAYRALGYVHAQDRLFQMEFQRRVGAGRLSELVGEATLGTDKFIRTLGVYRHAEASIAKLEPETRRVLEAYVDGVNAYLKNRRGALPPEFLLPPFRGYEPEPWTMADSLVWVKMMAWDLGGNWNPELMRARLLTRLSPEQVRDLYPPYPGNAPIILSERETSLPPLPWAAVADALPAPPEPGLGSNNWVVDGRKTVSGQPLLANDPHLGLQSPSLWYFAHLSAPGLEVIGATLPGLPAVLLGRNEKIAWGFTNTGPDVQDLFIERVAADDPARYETPEGRLEFETRTETIAVKGQEDVTLDVRSSRHGPILSDVNTSLRELLAEQAEKDGVGEYALALAWTALRDDDLTMQAGLKLGLAEDWQSFTDALQDWWAPQQNIVYADVEGNIGYYAPAAIPIRSSGSGYVPSRGWTGEGEWTGFIPFEELPRAFNPEQGQIVTANNQVVPDSYPHFLTFDWAEPYRVLRIESLLASREQHSPESFAQIQGDQVSLMVRDFLPFLRSLKPLSEQARDALEMVSDWNGEMDAEGPEPLIFSSWYRHFSKAVLEDELESDFQDYWGFRPIALREMLEEKQRWCDDVRTSASETCQDIGSRALEQGLIALNEDYGDNMAKWRWGEAHYANNDHLIYADTPLARFFDLTVPNGGDAFTINAARYSIRTAFAQNSGPGYRAVYDLADLNRSKFIHTTGQSGNPLSSGYDAFVDIWREVGYIPMTTDREAIEEGAKGKLVLGP